MSLLFMAKETVSVNNRFHNQIANVSFHDLCTDTMNYIWQSEVAINILQIYWKETASQMVSI